RPNIGRRRRRGNLPKEVTEYLKRWLILHKKHPYPTEREKQKLADETGLMVSQISNWFINARRR
ncbi:Homeodomain-like DNA binding domain-containing transcription factor, partial [Mucor lusitanicus CBS 277.49]